MPGLGGGALFGQGAEPMHVKTKSEQVADRLRGIVLQGRWEKVLPGYRILGRELGVGRIHIEAALARLTSEGLLAPAEPGKARKITVLARNGNPEVERIRDRVVLVVGPGTWDDLPAATLTVLREVREHAISERYRMSYETMNMIGRKRLGAHLARLIHDHRATRLLLVTPTQHLVLCGLQTGLPIFCLGGEIPKVAEEKCDGTFVLLEEMIYPAVVHLAMRGHTRILCPMQKGRELSRDRIGDCLSRETRFRMTKATFASTFPIQDLTEPGALAAFWEKQHRQYRPTAVIVQDFHHLLSFHQFCIGHGLAIPRDISVIGVFDHPSLPWITPKLSRFVVPTGRMSRKIIQWVERTVDVPQGLALVPPEAIEGDTVTDLR